MCSTQKLMLSPMCSKHRNNCECGPRHSLFKGHNVIVNIDFLNCQKWYQCLKCQVSGHKFVVLLPYHIFDKYGFTRGNTLTTTATQNSYKSYFKVRNQKSMKNTATTNLSSSMSKTSSSKLKDLSSNPGINISLYRSPSTNNPSAVPNAKI